eukprot:TRINITY_DN4644_c0_g2_i2.p1 TRINITY_DN4644_c0_g2~~TRINITY_DN4644_c0_g2_i2.p1  ORF type:complete len:812 (-),score=307.07 TRINITY_DN4644_c0_g2_i2:23-2458(-)
MSVVGFDLGNTSCTIAAAQKGGVDVLLNEASSRQNPSIVSFGEKERYLGEAANAQYMRNLKNSVTSIKRLIGRKWEEKEAQDEIKQLPFKTLRLPNGDIGVEVMYAGEQKQFSLTAVMAMLLQKLKQVATTALEGRVCKDVVLSVPGFWNDQQRRALLDASRIAGLNCLRLFNDTTATALSYGIFKKTLSETEPLYVAFVDMGHSSTQASVVEFLKGKLRVISTGFERNLGGRDFDQLLVDHFAKEFKDKYKIDVYTNPRALLRLGVACERVKKMLNTNPEAPLNIDSLMEDKDVSGMMTREKFEQMAKPLAQRALEPVKQAFEQSGIPMDKISALEIVGGASRLLAYRNVLTEFFKKDISQTLNAEEAVARGCALQCAMLSPLFKVREFNVTDITNLPVKVTRRSLTGDQAPDVVDIFTAKNPLPSSKHVTYVKREPFVLNIEYSQPELLPQGSNPLIGQFTVGNIPNLDEKAKVRVTIKLDINGIISVESVQTIETLPEEVAKPETPKTESTTEEPKKESATPMETEEPNKETEQKQESVPKQETTPKQEPQKKKVKRTDLKFDEKTAALSTKEVSELFEEENRYVAADRLAVETSEQKNAVESYVYDMRSRINEALSSYSTEQVRNQFSKLLEDTESWLYGEGEDVQKSVYAAKLAELKAVGDPIVKRKFEDENRYETMMQLRSAVQNFQLTAESENPAYEHIEKTEKQKIIDECKKIISWLDTEAAKQEKLPKHSDAVLTVSEMNKKKTDLEKLANPILNKPKPKPAPEPKKEEPKKEEPKPEEKKEEPKATEETKKDASTVDMDLD